MTDHCGGSSLLTEYERWLRARRSARTVGDRMEYLRRADRLLPYGLEHASEDELAALLAPYEGWTAATYDSHLRGFYTWCLRRGLLTIDPMADLDRAAPGPRVPHPCTDDELALAVATTPAQPWRRAVLLGAYAGLRCAEICSVTTDDVIDDRLRVRGKGRRVRVVPLHPVLVDELAPDLAAAAAARRADPRAPALLLCRSRRGRIAPQVLTSMQRPVWRRHGLPESFTLHSLRHWFATRALRLGADIREVQEMLGHSSVAMTMAYLAVAGERLRVAVARLPEPAGTRLGQPRAA